MWISFTFLEIYFEKLPSEWKNHLYRLQFPKFAIP